MCVMSDHTDLVMPTINCIHGGLNDLALHKHTIWCGNRNNVWDMYIPIIGAWAKCIQGIRSFA